MGILEYETLSKIMDKSVIDISFRLASLEMHRIQDSNVSFSQPVYLAVTVKGDKEMKNIVLKAEKALLKHISEQMKKQPVKDENEVILYATEYFNILCGHIIAFFNKLKHTGIRFSVPHLLKQDEQKDCQPDNIKMYPFYYKCGNEILSIELVF